MIYNVYTDLHYYGFNPVSIKIKPETHNEHNILIGDIVDIQQCRAKEYEQACQEYKRLKFLYDYAPGNHELCTDKHSLFKVRENVLFTHGDVLFWGLSKAMAYRHAMPRMKYGDLSFWFLKQIDKMKNRRSYRIDNAFKARCKYYCEMHKCRSVVMGHKHPKEITTIEHEGITIHIIPRGLNRCLIVEGEVSWW